MALRWILGTLILTALALSPKVGAAGEEIQVFDESTSFEQLVDRRQELSRNPASIESVARVIGVRRELGLSDAESAKAPQDIILNGGTNAGITEGTVLAIVRKVPIIDPYHDNQQSELEVEFGEVKVIHAQRDIAVARLEKIEKIDDGMNVGTRAVLVGDFVTRGRH